MNVEQIMTHPVITVTPETTIAETARLMLQHRISGLPVIDDSNAVVGIVTEGDLLRRAETGTERRHRRWIELLIGPGRLADEYVSTHARKVGEAMTTDVATIGPQASLQEVVQAMELRRVKRLPVVDGGKLVGIVSRADLVHALVGVLAHPAPMPRGDAEIRTAILDEIAKQPWGPRFSVDVAVKDGGVELRGSVTGDRERIALEVLAENISGVKTVRDNLVWVEPTSGLVIPAAETETGKDASSH